MQLQDQRFNQYRLERLLGSGGMGEVYLAHDERLDRQVAIKVVRTDLLLSSEAEPAHAALQLFKREAQAIARLSHPHILPLYAYEERSLGKVHLAYLVMPLCPEGSLSDWWKQRHRSGRLPLPEVAALLQQAASALQYAHDHRVIHRDVKPANFLLRSSSEGLVPDLLLADFGIAHVADASTSISFHVRGTPLYMAPEQWSGQPAFATDQYALAVMAYQMTTGRHPFQGGTTQMMYHHLHTPAPVPSRVEGSIPPALDVVLLKALEKTPGQRFPRIQQFAQAFEQGLGGATRTATTPASVGESPVLQSAPVELSSLAETPLVAPAALFTSQPPEPPPTLSATSALEVLPARVTAPAGLAAPLPSPSAIAAARQVALRQGLLFGTLLIGSSSLLEWFAALVLFPLVWEQPGWGPVPTYGVALAGSQLLLSSLILFFAGMRTASLTGQVSRGVLTCLWVVLFRLLTSPILFWAGFSLGGLTGFSFVSVPLSLLGVTGELDLVSLFLGTGPQAVLPLCLLGVFELDLVCALVGSGLGAVGGHLGKRLSSKSQPMRHPSLPVTVRGSGPKKVKG